MTCPCALAAKRAGAQVEEESCALVDAGPFGQYPLHNFLLQ
jgi:hypothetical protein